MGDYIQMLFDVIKKLFPSIHAITPQESVNLICITLNALGCSLYCSPWVVLFVIGSPDMGAQRIYKH